jgi:hypothetical protein
VGAHLQPRSIHGQPHSRAYAVEGSRVDNGRQVQVTMALAMAAPVRVLAAVGSLSYSPL